MPRDDIRPEDMLENAVRVTTPDHFKAKGSGLPQRMFAGPNTCEDAIRSMLGLLHRRSLSGIAFEIELTGIGATGDNAISDEEALLDSVSELLVATFRGSDLIARTGHQTFLVIAAPVPNDVGNHLSARLSKGMSELLGEWRQHGLLTCCAMSQYDVSRDATDLRFRLDEPVDFFLETTTSLIGESSNVVPLSAPVRPVHIECNGPPA